MGCDHPPDKTTDDTAASSSTSMATKNCKPHLTVLQLLNWRACNIRCLQAKAWATHEAILQNTPGLTVERSFLARGSLQKQTLKDLALETFVGDRASSSVSSSKTTTLSLRLSSTAAPAESVEQKICRIRGFKLQTMYLALYWSRHVSHQVSCWEILNRHQLCDQPGLGCPLSHPSSRRLLSQRPGTTSRSQIRLRIWKETARSVPHHCHLECWSRHATSAQRWKGQHHERHKRATLNLPS